MDLKKMYPPQKDSPSTFLTGDITATDTLLNVGNSAVLPQAVPYPLTLGFDKSVTETVIVTAIGSGNNQLTITRQAGALAWQTGTRCARVFTADDLKTLQDNVDAVNTALNGFGQPSISNLAELKAINTTTIVDKSMIFCEVLGLYRFDSGSSATGDDYFVVVPTTGGGRWLLLAEVTHGISNRFASAGAITDTNGNELIKFPTKVTGAVNEITVSNNTTGKAPILQSSGNDNNVGLDIKTKGIGLFRAFVNNVISFVSDARTNAVNYLTFKSNIAGSAPQINATGTDTNIDINMVPKGTGTVKANGVEVATTSGTQTMSNKTLSSPTIGNFTNAQHAHSSASEGGAVSHTALSNIGTNTHAQIDTHIADTATPHGATSSATANKIVIRDVNGRAQVSDPSAAADIATKAYVDARMDGNSNKTSVRVATTANITLSGVKTIDGMAVAAGDRVLVKNQTTASQNGIYIAASGSWTRATDADISAEVKSGLFTFVQSGTVNGSNGFTLTTPDPITLGSTALTFIQTSGAGQIIDGAGLSKNGNQLDVQVDNTTIEIVSDKIQLKNDGTTDAKLGSRTITDTTAPTADAGLLAILLSNLGYMIKSITGTASWRTAPATTLEAAKTHYSKASGIHGVTGDVVGTSNTQTLRNKTLTAPKISTIIDVSGNKLIKFPAPVTNAVNEITVTNAVTGSDPSISASGADTNVSLGIKAKGTGVIQVYIKNVLTVLFNAVDSAVNYLTFRANSTGGAPTVEATGSDANIDLNLVTKGTGRVKANGVKALLFGEDYRPNILINGDFRVNQRGLTTYTPFNSYTVDRWMQNGASTSVVSGVGIRIEDTNTYDDNLIVQKVENYGRYANKVMTLSVKVRNLNLGTNTALKFSLFDEVAYYDLDIPSDGTYSVTGLMSDSSTQLSVACTKFGTGNYFSVELEWVKLELNDHATPFVPRSYGEELAMCQRYYQKMGSGLRGTMTNETHCYLSGVFPVTMRIAPTVTLNKSSLALATWQVGSDLGGTNCQITNLHATSKALEYCSINGFTGGVAGESIGLLHSDDALSFDAEI